MNNKAINKSKDNVKVKNIDFGDGVVSVNLTQGRCNKGGTQPLYI